MQLINKIKERKKPFFSLEFFPPGDEAQLDQFYETADALARLNPLFVSVTYGAGGSKRKNTLKIASELAKRELEPMAHLTCVGAKPDEVKTYAQELMANGISNILALRGDAPAGKDWKWQDCHFQHATDLVSFLKKELPELGVAVAAYPSPHPESPDFESDRAYTGEKFRTGADFAITQLFFDEREYIDLISWLEKHNIHVPVIPGIFTIQSFESLKKILSLCGAHVPGQLYVALEEANAKGGKGAVQEAGLEFTIRQIRKLQDLGAPGFHLYTLNRANLCTHIIKECNLA